MSPGAWAEKSIEDLLEELNRKRHRLRQSGIDEELFDVVSGFEALGAKAVTAVMTSPPTSWD